jgi:excisionase family DNA binding protein
MKPAYRTLPIDWLTVAEAAQLLGVSKVAVYKALNVGRLEFRVIEGRKCIERRDLKARFWGSSQRLADQPAHARAAGADWGAIAEVLNGYLGDEWPGPPWSGDQAATVVMCMSLAMESAGD